MKKIFATVITLVIIATLAVCFAGCDDTNKDYPNGVIVVGITEYEPMDYKDVNSGKWIGFDADLCQIVFKNLGYQVRFSEINWDARYTELNSGNIACIWNGFTSNCADENDGIQRSTKVDFTYNYMINQQCVLVKKNTAAASAVTVSDLYGKKGTFESSSAGASYFATTFGDECTSKEASKQMAAITELLAESSDFAIVDVLLAKSLIAKGNDYASLKIVDTIVIDGEFYAVGFEKGSELTSKVNAQLVALAADGTLATIAAKYNLSNQVVLDYTDQIK